MTERYGEDVRPWPERGYWSDYRRVFNGWIASDEIYGLVVYQREADPRNMHDDDEVFWRWEVGAWSWMPDGDYWNASHHGMNANRRLAEQDGRLCLRRAGASWRKNEAMFRAAHPR